jgi:hypothetical protein
MRVHEALPLLDGCTACMFKKFLETLKTQHAHTPTYYALWAACKERTHKGGVLEMDRRGTNNQTREAPKHE